MPVQKYNPSRKNYPRDQVAQPDRQMSSGKSGNIRFRIKIVIATQPCRNRALDVERSFPKEKPHLVSNVGHVLIFVVLEIVILLTPHSPNLSCNPTIGTKSLL